MMNTHRCFRTSLVSFALMVLAAPANARLGETKAEITRRFGKGKSYRARGGWEQREYPKNGLTTYVVFVNDKSIWELTKRDSKKINDSDIQNLVKEASAGASALVWHAEQKNATSATTAR